MALGHFFIEIENRLKLLKIASKSFQGIFDQFSRLKIVENILVQKKRFLKSFKKWALFSYFGAHFPYPMTFPIEIHMLQTKKKAFAIIRENSCV